MNQMKFLLQYDKPKKKGYGRHSATFYDIRDAMWWERRMLDEGCKNTLIRPL